MKHLVFILISFFLLPSFACKKKGCTDFRSTNYDHEAEVDDGSCSPYGFFFAYHDDPCSPVSMEMGGGSYYLICGCTQYSIQRCDRGSNCPTKSSLSGPTPVLAPGTYAYTVYKKDTVYETGVGTIVDGGCFVVDAR